jgi:endoglucanase
MKRYTTLVLLFLITVNSFAQKKNNKIPGIWIDQFETSSGKALTKGRWLMSTDSYNQGESKFLQDSIQKCYQIDSTGNHYLKFDYILDKGDFKWDPYVCLDVEIADSQLNNNIAPLIKGLAYEYKGSKHNLVFVSSLVTDYAYHQIKVPESETWTTIYIYFDELKQPVYWGKRVDLDKATIKSLRWMISGITGEQGSLSIDNVRLLKKLPPKVE